MTRHTLTSSARSGASARWLLVASLLAGLLVSSCRGGDEHPTGPAVVARFGDEVITLDAFENELARRSARSNADFTTPEARQAVLDEMIAFGAAVDRARKERIDRDPEVLQEVDRVLVRHLRARQLDDQLAKVEVSDADVAQAYAAQQDRLTVPARSRAALVEVAVSERASPEVRAEQKAKAERLLVEAASLPESVRGFGAIAARNSDDQISRYRGGDIGWLDRDDAKVTRRYGSEVADAIWALNDPREIAPLVEAPDGFYLVMLLERTPASVRPLEQVDPYLRSELRDKARADIEADWRRQIVARVDVEVDQALFDTAQPPAPTVARSSDTRPPPLPK